MRTEFTTAVKVEARRRATRNSVLYCDKCGLPCRKHQVDHVIADAIGGRATLENAQVLCKFCYGDKNRVDTKVAAKTKRQEARHLGVKPPGAFEIQSAGFRKFERPERDDRPSLPPKRLFRE